MYTHSLLLHRPSIITGCQDKTSTEHELLVCVCSASVLQHVYIFAMPIGREISVNMKNCQMHKIRTLGNSAKLSMYIARLVPNTFYTNTMLQ